MSNLSTIKPFVVKGVSSRFSDSLKNWLDACKSLVLDKQVNAEWMAKHNHEYITLEVDDRQKFVCIWSVPVVGAGASRSSWAFVAKADGQSKAMGQWKEGDIFKCESWKKPAKHARGNIYDLSTGPTCNISRWTGPDYLK